MTTPIDLAAVRARSVEARAWLRTYDESSTQPSYTTGVIMRDLAEKADAMADEIEALRAERVIAMKCIRSIAKHGGALPSDGLARECLADIAALTSQPHRTAEEKAR